MASREETPSFEFVPLCGPIKRDGFRCTNPEINSWFKRRALKQHDSGLVRVTCAVDPDAPLRPLSFFALATVAEETSKLPGVYHPFGKAAHFSALQLVWLATDEAFERRGFGTIMVGSIIRRFAEIGPEIGLPHMIVVPARENRDRLIEFYSGMGFEPYKDGEAMFLSVQAAVDTVSRVKAQLERDDVTTTRSC